MSENRSEIRWLLVGTGDIASKRVGPALNGVEGSRVVGVVSRNIQRAREFAQQVGAGEAYGDLDEALRNTHANAVYVATAVNLHAEQVKAAARAGKHVLVEKPLALNGAEARAAAQAVASAKVVGGGAYYRRFSARFEQAKGMIERGELGKILLVRMVYHTDYNPSADDPKHWRVEKRLAGGGVLADMASHMIDVLIGLLGMPEVVSARVGNLVHGYEVEDTASVLMKVGDGTQVTGSFSWASKAWGHEMEIIGSAAKLKWSPFDAGKVVWSAGRENKEFDLPPAANVHLPLVEDFVQAIRQGRPPRVTMEEGAKTSAVLDAIYEAAAHGGCSAD